MGGFECSTQRNRRGKRIDVIAASQHDFFAEADYERLLAIGMQTARDGARWHLIEQTPHRYDFSSLQNQARAAEKTGIQIIWDLFHYGIPDDLDVFSPEFVERFTAFSIAAIRFLKSEISQPLFICPVNEISFFAWIAGQVGAFYPFAENRGDEMKRQLVKTAIAATDAIRRIAPETRFVQTDPAIRVVPSNQKPPTIRDARNAHKSQFHALDMLTGKSEPEIGGAADYLDVIGVNYYYNNQWRHPGGRKIFRGSKDYQPFNKLLQDFYERYQRPIFIAETGIEDAARPEWFRYVCREAAIAAANGVPVQGICLYPILNHPGWDDDRHCQNGLWDYSDATGRREIYEPLAAVVREFMA